MLSKKFVATAVASVFALSAVGTAMAADPAQTLESEGGNRWASKGVVFQKFIGVPQLEELAAEKGITVEELKAQMGQEREAKLEELAAEKGITVDELKEQMKQGPVKIHFIGDSRLEELAAEKGVTVEELKAQMEQEREAKLEELAAEQGISVEELKAQGKPGSMKLKVKHIDQAFPVQ